MAPRRPSSESKKQQSGPSSGPKRQPTLSSFFAKKPAAASAPKYDIPPASKRTRDSIDLTEDEPAAKRAQQPGGTGALTSSPKQQDSQPVHRQPDGAEPDAAAHLASPAQQAPSRENDAHAAAAQHAPDRGNGAHPAAAPRQPAKQSMSAAEKAALRAKAQRKLAQEAVRRGGEKGPAQPFTPLEKQVAALKRQHPGVMLLIEVWIALILFSAAKASEFMSAVSA